MILLDTPEVLVERCKKPAGHRLSLLSDVYVEPGSKDDWDLLHELHYKAENLGIGPKFWRCGLNGKTIGVGVMTVPKMLLGGRNKVFKHLKPNTGGMDPRTINQYRAIYMNKHSLTNSRLVLDTAYRGAGIAYRMQNIMMRMTGCQWIEFQSSMSKFNPFAEKAGMQFTKLARAQHYERGLKWFRRWFESQPSDFVGLMDELNAMPAAAREKCIKEMRELYYSCSAMEKSGDNRMNGTSRVEGLSVTKLVKSLQQLILASPLYGVYFNPDFGRELPNRIPILAFDLQKTNEPLDLDNTQKLIAEMRSNDV